jgi:hypothetical protein
VEALRGVRTPSPLPCFLEVLILKDFKSLSPEVLILIDFKSFAPEVLILVGLKSFIMREMQKPAKILEVLIPADLVKLPKLLILLALEAKRDRRGGRNSNVNAMYTQHYDTVLDSRQWRGTELRQETLEGG